MKIISILIFILIIIQPAIAQDFIHDTILISKDDFSSEFVIGVSSEEEIMKQFPSLKKKISIKKRSRAAHGLFKKQILLKNKFIEFEFIVEGENKKSLEEISGKLNSITIFCTSAYCFQTNICTSLKRSDIDSLYFEENKEITSILSEEKRNKLVTYPFSGFSVRFKNSKLDSNIQYITIFESTKTSDENFDIYLKWKESNSK